MFKYLINGELFEFSTEGQRDNILAQAREKGFSIELVEEEVETDFQKDNAEDVSAVSEVVTSENTDSTLEDGSSDFQSPDNKEEDFDFIDDVISQFNISVQSVASAQSRVPTFLNELKYTAAKMFLSDEDKEVLNELSPEMEQILVNSTSFGTNDIMSGELAKAGNEYYKESQIKIKKLNEELQQFDNGIVEDIFKDGNVGRGLARGFSAAIGSLPSVAQAMVPGIGIASIVAGSAAQASAEAQEKGADLDMSTMLYSGVIGAAEGLLELTTKKIGGTMLKSLAGKSKEVVTKTVKKMVLDVAKDAGAEGLSEGSTEAIKMIANAVYLGEEKTLSEALYQFADAFLIGGMMGGGMSGTGSGVNMYRNIGQGKKIKNNLNQTEYKTLADAYKTKETTKFLPVLSADENTEKFLNTELKNKVSKGNMTIEESNVIKENFQSSQQAVNSLKNEGIKPEFMSNELVDAAENVFALDKKFNNIDKKINKNLAKEVGEEIDLADENLENLISKSKTIQTTEETLGKFKNLAEDFKLTVTETDQKKADVLLEKAKGKKLKIEESAGYGFIYTDENNTKQIVLNKEAIYEDGMINTGAHEFLHYALSQGLKSTKDIKAISDSLMDLIDSSTIVGNKSQYDARVKQYQADFDKNELSAEAFAEEKLVLLSEALLNGDFKITENFKDKLNNIVRRLLSTIGVRAKFDNNQDALNFVKDYNRSITKGKLTRGQKNTIKKGARGSMVTANVVNKGTQEIKTSKATPKSDLKESKTLTIEQLTEKAEDLLEQSNLDSSNESLLDRYYDAMDAIAEMEDAESSESNTVVEQKEKKQVTKDDTPQPPRKKKDRSTKRYTLTDEQKAEIEPLIAEAQVLNKELIAKEKAATAARIKKITDKSERQMSRTDQAKAIADIKANPTRFEKGAKLTNLENKIQEKIKVPLNKLINAYTKRLYDGIPAQAKEVVSREDYQMEARAVVVTTLINEFKKNTTNRLGEKTTNDIEDLMFNRGYFRMLPLATDMGVASKVQGIAQRFDNVSNNIGTEDIMFDEKNNEPEMTMEGKFKISSFLPADAYDLALEQTKEFWEKNVGNSPIENFKKLPSLVDDIMADIFGVSLNVFTARSGNLNTTSYNNVLQAITKPYAVLKLAKNGKTEEIRVELNQVDAYESQLKDEGIEFERYADENILQTLFKFLPKLSADDYVYADGSKGRYRGKATGIPKNLVALTYENITRGTTGVGNRKANVGKQAYKDILNAIGGTMVDGKVIKRIGITGKSKEGQTLLGVLKLYNRMVTNEISRSPAVNLDPMTVKDLAAGKNNLMESKKIDLSGINKLNPEVDFEFSKWYNSRKKSPSSAAQFKKLSNISYNILGDLGRKLFNAELVYNFDKLGTDASLESIRDSIGKAWGKSYKWLVRNQGFNKAIEKLNENSTNEDVKQFLQGFSRAWRNDKYQDISTNEQLVETIEDQGVDFEGLGFKFVKRGGKGFIYEIKANGAIEFVNDPTTLLEIKNKSFDYIEVYGKNSVKEVQTLQKVVLDIINAAETVDDKIAAIEAMSIGQMGTLRRISYLRNVYKSNGPLVLEHVTSMAIIKEKLKDYARGEVDNIQEFFDGLYLDVIPKEVDDLLAKVGLENRYTPKIIRMLKGYEKVSFEVQEAIENIKESKRIENAIKEANLAKVKESKGLDGQFNKYLEGSTGVESFKRYKSDKAKLKGRFKGKLNVFIPPSAEDFLGLLYQTLNKGKLGNAQMKFYEDNLLKPYAKANSALRTARVRSIREFDAIKKKLKIVPKNLKRSFKFEDENGNMKDSLFTKEQAIRVYIWNSQGIEMPNLSQVDLAVLVNEVNANPELKAFADELLKLNRGMNSKAPSKNWMDGNIGIDLQANLNSVGRKKLLEVWQQNVDEIFSEENLNKLEAAYGPEYVKALESSLRRMRTGRSAAPVTDNEAGNNLITWLNSAVGNIMFFNNRSALLQMLSATNFLNFEDNNIIAAGKALMNIKQYSKDFVMLMNSDYLLDRRDGTRININEADIALIAKQSGIQGVIAKILEAGFLPTKYADSLAIGIGGATFYRTKVNALVKGGMSKAKAEAEAMQEFISVAETSQQSSDQSKISMEQAGSVGKIILAFNNTSSQYSRIIKRSVQDIYNRRGSDKANLAKIVYYGGMQNLLFNFMQQAMFAAMWGGEDDEEVLDGKKAKIVNSMADGLLRGMGVKAAIFVAIKNTAIKLLERSKKERNQDYRYYAVMGMLAVSPPLSSKASKLSRAASAYEYGKDKMDYGEFSLDSPELAIGANLISFATSLPTDRLLTKAINVSDALDSSNEPWERLFMTMGWPKWTLSTKAEIDEERTVEKAKIKTAKGKEKFDTMTSLEQKTEALTDLKKFQQIDSLKAYGLTDKEIRLLTKEKDRVNKIISLEGQEKKGLASADAVEEELYDLKKQQQIDSLTKYGLSKKQIRLLKYEEDRVKTIIKLQNKKRKNSLK